MGGQTQGLVLPPHRCHLGHREKLILLPFLFPIRVTAYPLLQWCSLGSRPLTKPRYVPFWALWLSSTLFIPPLIKALSESGPLANSPTLSPLFPVTVLNIASLGHPTHYPGKFDHDFFFFLTQNFSMAWYSQPFTIWSLPNASAAEKSLNTSFLVVHVLLPLCAFVQADHSAYLGRASCALPPTL